MRGFRDNNVHSFANIARFQLDGALVVCRLGLDQGSTRGRRELLAAEIPLLGLEMYSNNN